MNEQNEIEKLKRDLDEALALLEEVIRPHGIYDTAVAQSGGAAMAEIYLETGDKIKAAIEAPRPKPERLRFWANVSNDGYIHPFARISIHETKDGAERNAGSKKARIAIPMIEVRPLPELPEMEEWDKERVTSEMKHSERSPFDDYRELVSRHNVTVRAFKKWVEDVKKEVGDE